MDDLAVLVNPRAGSGRAPGVWESVVRRRPQLGRLRPLTGEPREVEKALAAGARRLIVVGGDGTVHWVVHRLLTEDLAARVAFGVVPAGTGCDFGRAFGVPKDPVAAVDRLLAASPRPVDAVRIDTREGRRRFSANVASAGISGVVDEAVNGMPRRSAAVYFITALRAFRSFKPVLCRVRVDGEEWYEGPTFLLAVANCPYFGKGMKVAPQAVPDDGLAEVVLVGEIPSWQLPYRLTQIYFGGHIGTVASCRRGTRVELEALEPLPLLDLDGETCPASGATFTVLPGVLRVLA